ncbi:cell division protein [Candidatus Photodesmus blepharus]|uniref:Cell division protein FtsB n=1 Tax=Candidatus Photodesmus blepharonis TaxID=1179155 RepID=A0A084CMR8_9GAMM|nr:cell division protein FtsB [Candidatus Photodesmus blepharus]KEY91097.1 cell division protein [Candidatus Photodesmus blepharus]
MRIFTFILVFLFCWLQYAFWFDKNGMIDFQTVSNEIQAQNQINISLQMRNAEMFAEIDDLRRGFNAIEERARYQLGMVKEGETFYRLVIKEVEIG